MNAFLHKCDCYFNEVSLTAIGRMANAIPGYGYSEAIPPSCVNPFA